MTFRSRTHKQRWHPNAQIKLVKQMRERDRLFRMVENWLSRHHQDFALTFERLRQRKYSIHLYFKELTHHIVISINQWIEIEVFPVLKYEANCDDELWWNLFYEDQLADGRFVCASHLRWYEKDPENRELLSYATLQEAIDDEILNPLLRWINTKLITATWLCFYDTDYSNNCLGKIYTDSEHYQQLHQKYLAGEPINNTEEKLQHIFPLFVKPLPKHSL